MPPACAWAPLPGAWLRVVGALSPAGEVARMSEADLASHLQAPQGTGRGPQPSGTGRAVSHGGGKAGVPATRGMKRVKGLAKCGPPSVPGRQGVRRRAGLGPGGWLHSPVSTEGAGGEPTAKPPRVSAPAQDGRAVLPPKSFWPGAERLGLCLPGRPSQEWGPVHPRPGPQARGCCLRVPAEGFRKVRRAHQPRLSERL